MSTEFPWHPDQGKRVRIRSTGKVGWLASQLTTRSSLPGGDPVTEVYVRPIGGGVEWVTSPDDIEILDDGNKP